MIAWFLMAAGVLYGLVAGLTFAFAVVVMPGLGTLPDRDFLKAFQRIDLVIQKNQPLFMIVWLGSAAMSLIAIAVSLASPGGSAGWVPLVAGMSGLLGVHLPTAAVNIPLNNALQATDLDTLSDAAVAEARTAFEPRWVRWNAARTVAGVLTAGLFGVAVRVV